MSSELANTAMNHFILRAALGLSAALLLSASAQAQAVQKCRIDGRIVFQTSPCPAEPRTVAPAQMQPVVASGTRKKTLADLLQERDASDRARPVSQPLQGDGADVLRSRMGAL